MLKTLQRRLSMGQTKDLEPDTSPKGNPKSDIALPHTITEATRIRRRSSLKREQTINELKGLTALVDAPASKREIIFKQKLELCSVVFNFNEETPSTSDDAGKDLKRNTLLELVDFIGSQSSIISESTIPCIMAMVQANIFRALPLRTKDFNPEEDEPVLEPAWPHLQVVYEFFL